MIRPRYTISSRLFQRQPLNFYSQHIPRSGARRARQRATQDATPSIAQRLRLAIPSRTNVLNWVTNELLTWRTVRLTLPILINSFIVGHLLTTYVFTIRPTIGPSMLPTISAWGDSWVFISKLHRRGRGVQVGDLVSYHHPVRPGFYGIKRVVGMPGDIVARDTPGKGEGWLVQVPEGHCWIVGDNLEWSRDSRMFGPLPLALVRGKVVAMVRPEMKWFKNGFVDVEMSEG